jgi:hypothetical protein
MERRPVEIDGCEFGLGPKIFFLNADNRMCEGSPPNLKNLKRERD